MDLEEINLSVQSLKINFRLINIPPIIIRDAPIKLIMSGITPKKTRSKIITKTSVE